jgi:hypothetical protein
MPPGSGVAAGNRLGFAVALALVGRKDNASPLLAKFMADVRLLHDVQAAFAEFQPLANAQNNHPASSGHHLGG